MNIDHVPPFPENALKDIEHFDRQQIKAAIRAELIRMFAQEYNVTEEEAAASHDLYFGLINSPEIDVAGDNTLLHFGAISPKETVFGFHRDMPMTAEPRVLANWSL